MPRLLRTERAHPRSKGLESLPLRRSLRLLHEGDQEAVAAVGRALPALARLCSQAERTMLEGGRIAYVGAGTSGRLGALDAAECPPTFGVPKARIFALVAGGRQALARAVEGAEDDEEAGREAVRRARLGRPDLVVGLSASGRTPFVLAALSEAGRRGARIGFITSNPGQGPRAAQRVVLDTGPEFVAGSTRLKAGSAMKMALSLFSTALMARLGRVRDGRMIELAAGSEKLRQRAIRMVGEMGRVSRARAEAVLSARGFSVRAAVEELRPGAFTRRRGR